MNEPFSFGSIWANLDKTLEAVAKASVPGYPPFNIVKNDENNYTIEMAVAGFGKQNLDIEMDGGSLIVKGSYTLDDLYEERDQSSYIFKGIAARPFTRKFKLADTVEVKDAELINGMLKIFLENVIPEHKKPKKVSIK